jgi:nucleoside-diphosphate-sugar epimerase
VRYFVAGGAGYFGTTLIQKLLLDKESEVICYDLNETHLRDKNLKSIIGDIRDKEKLNMSLNSIDVVFHNVAQVPIAKNIDLFWSVNRDGTKNLLESSLKSGVKKFIYTSSSAVFGIPKKNPVTNITIPLPAEDYGKAKLAGEELCLDYISKGLKCTIIRPRTILGTGRLGIFQILFEWVYQGKNIPVIGNGKNLYQFIHAEDLADACIASTKVNKNYIFNVGAENFCTMRETLEALIDHANTKSKIKSLPLFLTEKIMNISSSLKLSPLAPYHALMYGRSMYFDTDETYNTLGFKPLHSNISMIIENYDWYVKNRERILENKNNRISLHQSPLKQKILRFLPYIL